MELSQYLALERGRVTSIAKRMGIAQAWLSQMAAGRRPVPPALVPKLAGECEHKVPFWALRPHDWHAIWPELIGTPGAPAPPAQEMRSAA